MEGYLVGMFVCGKGGPHIPKYMMKKTNLQFISVQQMFKDERKTEPMISLNSLQLLALCRELGPRLVVSCFPNKVKPRIRYNQLFQVAHYLLRLRRVYGPAYVVHYLKCCQLAVQKRVAGVPLSSFRELNQDYPFPGLARCGLPKIIGTRDRLSIIKGSPSIIRWWLTIFSIYRIIRIPGKLKLSTITDPYSGDPEFLVTAINGIKSLTLNLLSVHRNSLKSSNRLLFSEKASPSSPTSWTGILFDALSMAQSVDLRLIISKTLPSFQFYLEYLSQSLPYFYNRIGPEFRHLKAVPSPKGEGQLSIKEEAAGKLRVFAMVDAWTQSALKPLHDYLFSILSQFPNDGTFDQQASVNRCHEKARASGGSYGYDLSAATDRLPVVLQEAVLSSLLGAEFAAAWRNLLVNRDYILPVGEYNPDSPKHLRYAVGQPMGALSS